MTILITEEDCERVLSIKDSIAVIEEVFRMAGEGTVENPPRFRMPAKKGKGVQFGAAALHAKQLLGFKVWANFGSPRKQRWNFLYDMRTSELLAIVQATTPSKYRTAAATAVAVRYLTPPEASVVGIYGTGRQAEAQIEAICAVRPIRAAHVYSRTPENRDTFCRRIAERLGISALSVEAPELVPRDADIIVTMTNSTTPVLFGDWITRPGLVVGVGANHEFEREVDEKIVTMAKLVVVDAKEASQLECGDLIWPISHGLLRWDQVQELGQVVAGRVPLPDFASGIILFESQGVTLEDVAIVAHAYERAKAQGLGREIEL